MHPELASVTCSPGHLHQAMQGLLLLPGFCFLLNLPEAVFQYVSVNTCSCPLHASCIYGTACTCNPGFKSSSGQDIFTFPLETCADINECQPPISVYCGLNGECENTEGSFHCRCVSGYQLASGGVTFKNSTENTCQKSNSSTTTRGKEELQEVVNNIESLLTNKTLRETGNKGEIALAASALLQSTETMALEAALKAPELRLQKVQNSTVAITTHVLRNKCSEDRKLVTLTTQSNSVQLHCDDVTRDNPHGPSAIAFISYSSLGNILNETFFEMTERVPSYVVFQEEMDHKEPVYLNSQIVSAAIGPNRSSFPLQFVTLTLSHIKMKPRNKETLCVYWKVTGWGSHWSTDGCFLVSVNDSHTVCNTTHLSSFAVLMALTNQEEDLALTVITYVGLSLSLLCLLLAALTFLLCKAIQNTSTSLHLHLSICLFLAHLLFLTAIDRTEPKVLCAITAGALHYLYLASFTWMLLEGLHLFLTARNLTVVNYSSINKFMKWMMYPAGYGVPAVIVAISAASRPHLYGTPDRCWLQLDKGFIWGFLGPVCAIVCVNLVLFVSVLWILKRKLSSLNSDVSTIQNTRMLTFKATAQVFILGCTWCLGVLQVGPAAQIMAYLFTIINTLQGVFIFLVYCLLSQQVQKQYQKWFTDITKSKSESEAYTLSSKFGPDTKHSESK
ncbi:adhesion G protein-coupled receptor E3 [Castor canadensis]|uniref:Adhesion G protein-coupled receptor E3 n=2 Tax=Castor canadensis TaxID=51338 RepID=A0A8C0XE81_CASCN